MRCVDCGKERTAPHWRFTKPSEEYRCHPCTNKKISKDQTWINNHSIGILNRSNNPEWIKNHNEMLKGLPKNKIWQEKHIIVLKNLHDDENIKNENVKRLKRLHKDPVWLETVSRNNKLKTENPEYMKKIKISNGLKSQDPIWKESFLIGIYGQGFWYGHPILNKRESKIYCELWNRDLWNRIDAAWNYKSAISGKTKEDNKGKDLDRHHVYWQEKSCCVWDEDKNGYYANINLGTGAKPNIVKYYINGDPNKFVLLTHSEHSMIKGNKKLGTNKITWIKFFEDLIEQREKEGKRCYLQK
jgi:hypothetical protein